jgi:hypothetical protein
MLPGRGLWPSSSVAQELPYVCQVTMTYQIPAISEFLAGTCRATFHTIYLSGKVVGDPGSVSEWNL